MVDYSLLIQGFASRDLDDLLSFELVVMVNESRATFCGV